MEPSAAGGATARRSQCCWLDTAQVAYVAGKAALMQLTQTSAVVYAARQICLNAVMPLAADESRYITGQQIVVDGAITSATR